jgi:hypothetical protein
MKNEENGGGKTNIYSFTDLSVDNGFSQLGGDNQVYRNVDELPKEPEPSGVYRVRFSMFRTGQWDHPWYGSIEFDREYLETLKANFDNGIVPRRIMLDLEHERNEEGAPGEIEDLILREGFINTPVGKKNVVFLDAVVAFNSFGASLLVDRRYAHCSAEIHPDFTTNERIKVETRNENGERGSGDTVLSHGPAVIGCALTNRPFIPSLGEVIEFSADAEEEDELYDFSMSDDSGTGIRFYSYRKFNDEDIQSYNESLSEEGSAETTKTFATPTPEDASEEEPEVGDEDGAEQESESNEYNEPNEGETMELAELMQKVKTFNEPNAQLDFLKEVRQKFSGDAAQLVDELIETKEFAVRQKEEADRKVSEAVQRKRQAEQQAQEYATEKQNLELELAEAREGEWEQRVQNFGAQLREQDHHESLVKTVVTKLSAINSESRAQKFTVLSDSDGKAEEGLIEILEQCFASIPESARLDTSEKLEGNKEAEVAPEGEGQEFSDGEEEPSEEEALRQKKVAAYTELNDTEPEDYMIPDIDPETGAFNFGA